MNFRNNIKYVNISFSLLLLSIGIYASIFQSTVSNIAKSYHVSSVYMGSFITLYFIGCLVGAVILGELADRMEKKRVIILSILIMVSGIFIIYLIKNLLATNIGVFVVGVGINGIDCVVIGALSDVNKGKEVKYMNMAHALYCLGTIIGPLLVMAFVRFDNWRVMYFPVAILFLILMVYIASLNYSNDIGSHKNEKESIISLELIKKPSCILLSFSMFLYVGVETGTTYWMGTYINSVFRNEKTGMALLSLFWGGMMVGRYMAGRFHRMEDKVLFWGLVLSIVFSSALQFSNHIIFVSICITMTGVCLAPVFCAIVTKATRRYPEVSGSATGVVVTLGSLGGVSIPFLMGVISQKLSVKGAFFFIPLILVVLVSTLLYDKYSLNIKTKHN
jgi:Major Facilitator Superfamily.